MTRKTFEKRGEEQILVYEERYNEEGKIKYYKDYKSTPEIEQYLEYNTEGLLIKITDYQDEVEINRQEIKYNERGQIIEELLFICDELYRQEIKTYNQNSYSYTVMEDGEEVLRGVELYYDDEESLDFKAYEYGEFERHERFLYNKEKHSFLISLYEEDGTLISEEEYPYDEVVIDQNELAGNESTYRNHVGKRNHLMVKALYYQENEYKVDRVKDNRGNEIKKTIKDEDDRLLGFVNSEYDHKGRLISEFGYGLELDTVYGVYSGGDEFHFVHEYHSN